ncbi:hypothetical protein SPI_07514 [Niveomyces insectorum RCEF 264]|uniref:Uncharacterized protein n=1 Tax=Niveomyces insectorum RCEF 264 TaxID=1081102 RepID=A0A167PY19_9HYPO|nr:hypothetical protein SPI_07514 [Niveomyces insectorum RCEF 264]
MAGLREDSTVLDWVIAHEDSFAVESNDSVPLPTPRPSPIQPLKPKPTSDEAIEPESTFDQPPLGGEGPIAIAECLTSASARTHSDGSKHAPIMLETIKGLQASPASKAQGQQTNDIRRLAADKMSELTASLPMAAIPISAEVDKVRIYADNVDISDSSLDSARNHTWFSTADGGEDGGPDHEIRKAHEAYKDAFNAAYEPAHTFWAYTGRCSGHTPPFIQYDAEASTTFS